MKYAILLILIYLAYNVVVKKDYERFKYIFVGLIFIPGITPLPSPGLDAHRFLILSFILSLAIHKEFYKFKDFPLGIICVLMIAAGFMTGYMDERISSFSKIWKPLSRFFIEFGFVFIGYLTCLDHFTSKKFITLLTKTSLLVGLYGFVTLIVKVDPYSIIFSSVIEDTFCDFTPSFSGRMRICSVLMNSHIYGSYCCAMSLFLFYLLYKKVLGKTGKFALAFMVIGLITSGSRSALMGFCLGMLFLVVLGTKSRKLAKRIFMIGFVCFGALQVPIVQQKTQSITNLFDPNATQTDGSTIEGRENQFDVSMMIFSQNPIWGNGYDYWGEVVMGNTYWKEQGIYGAESYIFILLIERGLIQIIVITIFFIASLILFLRRLKYAKYENALAFSILISFIGISIMTGNTNKWPLFFPLLGILMNKQNVKYIKNYSLKKI